MASGPVVKALRVLTTRACVTGWREPAESLAELEHLGLVETAQAQIRVHSSAPLFKIYLLNTIELFFGFYPVVEHTVSVDGKPMAIYDAMGKEAILFPFTPSDEDTSNDALYVEQARAWFDSLWGTIAREYAS